MSRQQGLSRTLPKRFTFPSRDPKTPECSPFQLDVPPPPPHHASNRLSKSSVRPQLDIVSCAETARCSGSADIPLPSIEMPLENDAHEVRPCNTTIQTSTAGFLAPPRGRLAFRTPPAQIRPISVDSGNVWHQQYFGNSVRRSGSVCSNASNSSVWSVETFATPRSVDGSCTSLDSDDIHDPFLDFDPPKKQTFGQLPASSTTPLAPKQQLGEAPTRSERWSSEMDNHLWNTYQLYIQNPMITPFKMTPGSIPPLGVTHRVAHQAKRSWGKQRRLTPNWDCASNEKYKLRKATFAQNDHRDSATPTPVTGPTKRTWPRSEASTRRRLKLLCKRKFSIAPHYKRMLQSRSPEPSPDLFSQPTCESSNGSSTAYATRDLGVSLASSVVADPLSQIAAEGQFSDNWFNSPVQNGSQHDLSDVSTPKKDNTGHVDKSDVAPRLGSPFVYKTWGPSASRRDSEFQTPRPRRGTIHVTGSRLQSPPRIRTHTNRNNDFAEGANNIGQQDNTERHLEELMCQGKLDGIEQGCVRVRSRGATISSVKSLDQLFSPLPPCAAAEKIASNSQFTMEDDAERRLGSPFPVEGLSRQGPSVEFERRVPSIFEQSGNSPVDSTQTRKSVQSHSAQKSAVPYDSSLERCLRRRADAQTELYTP